tara:strand:+ start:13968 stop:14594 length:627 start_codon:yes stop_codon:yes gene_type:complete
MAETYASLAAEFIETRSEQSYTKLYHKMRPALFGYVRKIVKDKDVTEDIVAITMSKVYTKIDQYNPEWQITTWTYKIAFNECLIYIKARNKKVSLTRLQEKGVEATEGNSTAAQVGSFLLEEEVNPMSENDHWDEYNNIQSRYETALEEIHNLKEIYKDILVDRLLNKMKYHDISEKYNLPLQTVKNRIRRGKYLVAKSIDEKSPSIV